MKEEFIIKLRGYSGLKNYLQKKENKPLWFNQQPAAFTTLYGQFDAKAAALGAFGDAQSQNTTGITLQQNLAETALEDAAHPLCRAFRLLLISQNNQADAAQWDLSLTDWRKLQEQPLLDRANALKTALDATTQGTNPTGTSYGITAAKVADFDDHIGDYEDVMGAPGAARATRKAKTADLRPRFRVVDSTLADMDDLIVQLRGTPEGDLFVDGYFNVRRIGGQSSGGAAPTPPAATPPSA